MDNRKFVLSQSLTVFVGELILSALMVAVFAVLGHFDRSVVFGAMAGVVIADIVVAKLLYQNGYVISLIELPLFVILIYAYHLIQGYLMEVLKKRKIVSAFKKYVAPSVTVLVGVSIAFLCGFTTFKQASASLDLNAIFCCRSVV